MTYSCEVNANPDHATCTSNNQVTYTSTATNFPEATVTVTNTYVPPAPSAPPALGEAPPAAEPVTAAAQFTG